MDVQAIAPTLASKTDSLPPLPVLSGGTPVPASSGEAPAAAAPATVTAAPAPAPGLPLLPPAGGGDAAADTLPGHVAKIYQAPADTLQVSFQPAAGSNEIVTVFTDKNTGKVVVQFPSETLIALAQFFQKLDSTSAGGAVLDKKV